MKMSEAPVEKRLTHVPRLAITENTFGSELNLVDEEPVNVYVAHDGTVPSRSGMTWAIENLLPRVDTVYQVLLV